MEVSFVWEREGGGSRLTDGLLRDSSCIKKKGVISKTERAHAKRRREGEEGEKRERTLNQERAQKNKGQERREGRHPAERERGRGRERIRPGREVVVEGGRLGERKTDTQEEEGREV